MSKEPTNSQNAKVRIPWWLLLLDPEFMDLAENPLYLRLSEQRFCRKRKWYRFLWSWKQNQIEWAKPEGTLWENPGWSPFIALFIPVFLVGITIIGVTLHKNLLLPTSARDCWVGLIAYSFIIGLNGWGSLGLRMRGQFGRGLLTRCINNFGRESWGEMLFITRLRADEYDKAICAVTCMFTVRNIVAVVPALAFVESLIGLFGQLAPPPGERVSDEILKFRLWLGISAIEFVALTASFLIQAVLLVGYLSVMSIFGIAFFKRHYWESLGKGVRGNIRFGAKEVAWLYAMHFPGTVIAFLWIVTTTSNLHGYDREFVAFIEFSREISMGVLMTICIVCVCSARMIRNSSGCVGEVIFYKIREKYET